jgi:hypothetical protein
MKLIQTTLLGEWIFKSKSKQNSCGLKGACMGFIFALQVTEQLEIWPEHVPHDRRWVSVSFFNCNCHLRRLDFTSVAYIDLACGIVHISRYQSRKHTVSVDMTGCEKHSTS